MKKLLLSAFVAFSMLATNNIWAQQGFGTNRPDKSAAVDIVSSQRGLLVPRLNLTKTTGTNNNLPVLAPAHGLLVYNKANTIIAEGAAVGVEPGFYYWERTDTTDEALWAGKWVRIISSNSDKNTVVVGGENVKVNGQTSGLTTTYTVSVDGGTNNGQVLVSVPNTDPLTSAAEPFVSKWVNPSDFIKGINGINVATDVAGVTNVGIGGSLTKAGATEIITNGATNSLAIKGLEVLNSTAFNPSTQNIIVLGADGILKQVAPKVLMEDAIAAGDLTAKKISSTGGIITINNTTELTNSVLKDVELGIANKSIGVEKLNAGTATPGQIATVVETTPGNKEIQYVDPSTGIGKNLTTDNIIGVGADNATASAATANSLVGAVLKPTYLKIKDNSITSLQIGTGAVGTDELVNGAVTNDKIGADAITSNKILNGTIKSEDIQAPGSLTNLAGTANQVMVTDLNGNVTWVNQSSLANKDTFTGTSPISVTAAAGTNATGGKDYTIAVANANGTTLGVVKQSAPTGEEITIGADGSLSVNESNVSLGGDVSGQLSATVVGAIQGIPVSTDDPTSTNNMLVFQNGKWEPSTVAAAAGKTLTGDGITVTAGTTAGITTSLASSVLADVTLGIANGAVTTAKIADNAVTTAKIADGAVTNTDIAAKSVSADKLTSFTTSNGTATPVTNGMVPTADGLGGVTYKTINNTVAVINGLRKDATAGDVIKLGGNLMEATAINTAVGAVTNTLAVTGLINVVPTAATKNKVIVAETTGGVLRTVDKVVTGTNIDIVANTNYSFHTPEVVVNVTLADVDQTVVLPSAASAEGQVINIKIANTVEGHKGYLNVLDTYGSMPYQGWIVKSDGATWKIVGRN